MELQFKCMAYPENRKAPIPGRILLNAFYYRQRNALSNGATADLCGLPLPPKWGVGPTPQCRHC